MAFSADDELDIGALFAILWRRKVQIILAGIGCAFVAGGVAFALPKKYVARVVVAPVRNQTDSQVGSVPSGLGILASVAGFRAGGDEQATQALATLRSQALAERYINENGLLKFLFASKWDAQQRKWKAGSAVGTRTLWKGYRYFDRRIRKVETDKETGLISVRVTWFDAALAAQWANGIVELANESLRQKAIENSSRNIAYLEDQVSKTQAVEIRNSVYSLMETEIKKTMLAKGAKEYAFAVIDPATAPEEPESPKPLVWVFLGAVLGVIVGIIWALLVSRVPLRNE